MNTVAEFPPTQPAVPKVLITESEGTRLVLIHLLTNAGRGSTCYALAACELDELIGTLLLALARARQHEHDLLARAPVTAPVQ